MMKLLMTCGLTLALTACATSQPSPIASAAPAAQTSAIVTSAPKVKLVCEDTRPLGSHIPQRICLTREQIEARKKATQEAMRRMDSTNGQGGFNPNGSGAGGPPL